MTRRLVTWVLLLACVILPAIPAMASTSGTTVSGTVPLLIFDVQASNITNHTATISWKTNGSANSQVFYDINVIYTHHSPLDNTLVVQHSVPLNGLSPSTTYHYMVKSVAVIGGDVFTAVSPDLTFKTSGTLPCVMTICALPVGTNCAVLWGCLGSRGGASTEVYFQYGTTNTYGSETPHQTLTGQPRPFIALVNNLLPGTTYHFRAVAAGDGTSYGDDKVFRTLPQPVITVVAPDGGESWKQGTRQTIRWTYANVNGNVKIELLKGGVLNRVISHAAPRGHNGIGSYSWVIPSNQTIGSDYMIRVTSISEPDCNDASNNSFNITKK